MAILFYIGGVVLVGIAGFIFGAVYTAREYDKTIKKYQMIISEHQKIISMYVQAEKERKDK